MFGPEETRRFFERKAGILGALLASPHVLFPGAAERVREYAAVLPLAIASGARREEIEPVLTAAHLRSCFTAIVAAGETPRAKPAPDPYARAMALLV
ncbi:MAG: Phosphorylated carbohydrates phosphatase, partial [Acidobacteria bacterium]|nr:Phosphorylated carbohydrates phosphatase [Acidobacteriota bacterium]